MRVKPTYSPAEAIFKAETIKPSIGLRPAFLAMMPREKDTAK